MRIKILLAGDKGYLYIDLVAALVILSLAMTGLFSAARTLKQSQLKAESVYENALDVYEEKLLEQTRRP